MYLSKGTAAVTWFLPLQLRAALLFEFSNIFNKLMNIEHSFNSSKTLSVCEFLRPRTRFFFIWSSHPVKK